MQFWLLICLLCFGFHQSDGARILGIFAFNQKSHYVFFEALMKGLVERGHVIDVISHFPQKEPIKGFNDISISGSMPLLMDAVPTTDFDNPNYLFVMLDLIFQAGGVDVCRNTLNHTEVQKIYNSTTEYDLLITEVFGTDCFLSFAHKFNIPVVGVGSTFQVPWGHDRFGLIDNPAYIPVQYLGYSERMTLWERIHNTIFNFGLKLMYHYQQTVPSDAVIHELLDPNMPSMYELANKMNLMLVNTHFSVYGSRPTPPNVVEIAGIHVTQHGKLSQDIEKLLNESNEGVVFFSLGSIVRADSFPLEKLQALINTFGNLSQTVLWKGRRENINVTIPENVHIQPWFSQREVLCHPNTKLFITHGGILGTQESIYCGVPMIGIPLFADQPLNIQNYERKGIAYKLDLQNINQETFQKAVNTVLYDPSYTKNVKLMSQLFRDQPMDPMDKAAYWIEYVIKYKGAPHLKPQNAFMPWYQIYLIDVWLVLISAVIITIGLVYISLKLIYMKINNLLLPNKLKQN